MLDQHGIPYETDKEINQLDNIYLGDALDPMIVVKLARDRFTDVTGLLAAQAETDFQQAGFTHYFQSFEAADLKEVLQQPNDWNGYDVRLLPYCCRRKYNMVMPTAVPAVFSDTYKPESIDNKWIVVGYMLCALTILGIIFGLSITQAKKTLQNGETVPIYDTSAIWARKKYDYCRHHLRTGISYSPLFITIMVAGIVTENQREIKSCL